MKQKEYFLIHTIILSIFILSLSIIASFTDKTIDNNIIFSDEEKQDSNQGASLFDETIEVINLTKYNNQYLAYGSKDNFPYISIIDNEQNKVTELEYKDNKGKVTNIDYNGIYLEATIENNKITETKDFFISNNNLVPFYKKQLTINYSKNTTIKPQYLVIHETANTKAGANASAHYRYWSTNTTANASTHFVVDSNEIYQMLELNQMAWHVGDNKTYSDIKNTNSIGIELCVNSDGDYMQARQYTIDLTIAIMNKLNMNINQLKKHQDASGKYDPIIMLNNNLWDDFVSQVELGLNN